MLSLAELYSSRSASLEASSSWVSLEFTRPYLCSEDWGRLGFGNFDLKVPSSDSLRESFLDLR